MRSSSTMWWRALKELLLLLVCADAGGGEGDSVHEAWVVDRTDDMDLTAMIENWMVMIWIKF